MPSRPARPQLGLFDNPAGAFSLEELTETVRALERQRPGRTVDELSRAVFAELAMKRTRRSAELVAEAIRLARAREPHAEISGSRWQASTADVRNWALNAGFEIGADGSIPEQAITAYNHIPATRTEPHAHEDTNAATRYRCLVQPGVTSDMARELGPPCSPGWSGR